MNLGRLRKSMGTLLIQRMMFSRMSGVGTFHWSAFLKTRNSDWSDMSNILRDLLEERWPGAMPEGYQKDIDDLLQDHQYDKEGRRIGPTSMMDLDTFLSAVYRNPVA